jgi:S-adenosylmethionine:tRNA ribosyltransferase-isomerase
VASETSTPRDEPDDSLGAFDYPLPRAAIAQRPAAERDLARLLVVHAGSDDWTHARFRDLGRSLRPGDVLVLNDSKVIPARIRGAKASGGQVEALVLGRHSDGWMAMLRASRRPGPGAVLRFGDGVEATVVRELGDGRVILNFPGYDALDSVLARIGEVPLPPYIRRPRHADAADRERYQTVYARVPGAVAAPTAGLHFTPALLDELRAAGVVVVSITLHVGPATFAPLRHVDLRTPRLDGEEYEIPADTVRCIDTAKAGHRRVIAVGTTTTRALEGAAADAVDHRLRAGSGNTDLFIRPGHRFRVIDGLITNFHLPRSSLLVLTAAFLGRHRLRAVYAEALARGYRFYSYGDAMFALGAGECREESATG